MSSTFAHDKKRHSFESTFFPLLENNVVLSYAIIHNYKVICSETISQHGLVQQVSLFQACSLSKLLTALGVLMLATQKKIDIDISINEQLKTWRIKDDTYGITPRQCLSMTSGLCYGLENPPIFDAYLQRSPIPTLKNILNGEAPATNLPVRVYIEPGVDCIYTGAGFMVAQQLIEDTSGLSFAQFMQDSVLEALHMKHSTFACPLDDKFKEMAVSGINKEGEFIIDSWENIPTTASGGLWSTADDLAKALLFIVHAYCGPDNQFLSKELAQDMLSLQKSSRFGLGLTIDGEKETFNFRKNGHNAEYHNQLIMFPNVGSGIVIMTNTANGMPIIKKVIEHVAQRYQWPDFSRDFNELRDKTYMSFKA